MIFGTIEPSMMSSVHSRVQTSPNKWMQLTWRTVTPLAFARRAPFRHAADPNRYAIRDFQLGVASAAQST